MRFSLVRLWFQYWNDHDRSCAYGIVGTAQTYLASPAMTGFHNGVIPLLVSADAALGIHTTTRFPNREFTFVLRSIQADSLATDSFRNKDIYLQGSPDRFWCRRYTSHISASLLSRFLSSLFCCG